MKSIRTTLIAASLLAGLSGLTLAQTAPEIKTNNPRAERMDKMHAKMGERHAKHLADLKGKRISAGSAGSATEVMAFRLMEAAGIDPMKDITRERLSVAPLRNGLFEIE